MRRARTTAAAAVLPPPVPGDPLLDAIGPLPGARVLVIGHGALETMCTLIRRGCAAATELRSGDRLQPDPESVDAVVVPRVGSAAEAGDAIARAARALAPGGHIALRDVTGQLDRPVAALLRVHGFSALRARPTPTGTVISAERPIFGPLPRA
jgi:hypothetical protein